MTVFPPPTRRTGLAALPPLALLLAGCAAARTTPTGAPGASSTAGPPASVSATMARGTATGPADSVVARILRDQESRVVDDTRYLSDVVGPRLTGSPAMRRAAGWARDRLQASGADTAWIESYAFGRAWDRGPIALTMLAPHDRELHAASWGWAPGTRGAVNVDVSLVDATTVDDFRGRFGGRLAGRWVMTRPPQPVWEADAPPTATDSLRLDSLRLAQEPRTIDQRTFRARLVELLVAEGVAGLIGDAGREDGLLTMSGSPLAPYPFPYVVVPHATYASFHRLLSAGERVQLRADVFNSLARESSDAPNVVAELRGRERPDEVVLVASHLDSWDLGSGAIDNATGAAAVIEALRVIRAAGVRPGRTIRFALFSGHEQGHLGAEAYAASHEGTLGSVAAVLVLAGGTGRVTGVALQGRDALRADWEAMFGAAERLGPFRVRSAERGGSDHLPFLVRGVPSFALDQLPRGYSRLHHSQADTFDQVIPAELRQAATVLAALAWQLAERETMLPRR